MAKFCLLFVLVCFPAAFALGGIDSDNLRSTLEIVRKTCYYPRVRSEDVAQKFIGCYDEAPGKEQFMTCQREVFDGVLFDSVANIKRNCMYPLRLPSYASCITREFDNAGLDQNDAVRTLNACQLPVVS